ncbi:hypothetical protein P3T35_007327 [Kitasatospora sp. GP30]|uniref:hypothetical protein n=1 Tax=Kitasatospora sp. GP30 TaxID=3035084 RepID=UPI000C70E62E|nr:hypothetical protein [Kitasatospora sp. GP30]MDH6145272.1 hypothetical protein [Kitasatospora sp. GP30]
MSVGGRSSRPATRFPAARPARTAYARGAANPNGSTTALRADVLTALGLLKVATADQLQRLLRPRATVFFFAAPPLPTVAAPSS